MNRSNLILIAGVGRSGTTWVLSEIHQLSEMITLFEPFAPIQNNGKDFRYSSTLTLKEHNQVIKKSLSTIQNSAWLYRHLDFNNRQLKIMTKNQPVIYKEIRLNKKLDQLSLLVEKIIVIDRNPVDIFLSQMARPSFYNDLGGIDRYWEKYIDIATIDNVGLEEELRSSWDYSISSLRALIMLVDELATLKRHSRERDNISIYSYEALLKKNEIAWKKLLGELGIPNIRSPKLQREKSTTITLNPDNSWLCQKDLDRNHVKSMIDELFQHFE